MKTFKKLFSNPYLIFILFIFLLSIQNYIFCVMYTADHLNPWLVDENGNYVLSRIAFSFGLYYLLIQFTNDAARPLIDSFTTIFSFIATYMTAKKWIENWLYWILINVVSVYLYYSRGLEIYAFLMLINAIIAAFAYYKWKKILAR